MTVWQGERNADVRGRDGGREVCGGVFGWMIILI